MMIQKKIIFFPGLNMLRFIAATLVVIYHVESFKFKAGYTNLMEFTFFKNIGTQAVSLFFVLSGFLITYLLLSENKEFGSIALKKFYLRRILRIWPLYFLILVVGFFIMPHFFDPSFFKSFGSTKYLEFVLSVFFMPNISLILFGSHFLVGVLWSIGAEEQFYLIWPLFFLKSIKPKKLVKRLFLLLISIVLIKFISSYVLISSLDIIYKNGAKFFIHYLYFDCMLVGAFFAYLLHYKKTFFNKIITKSNFILVITLFIILINLKIEYLGFRNIIFSTINAIIISYLSTQIKINLPIIENKFWKWGGNISYGIYMYHSLFVGISIYLYPQIGNTLVYVISLFGTLLLSTLSYKYFEIPFLNHKKKFMRIKSTN